MIGIDTNLLVYAHRSGTVEHKAARKAMEKAAGNPAGWGIVFTCLVEFWSIVTHPSCIGGPSSPREASTFLRRLLHTGGGEIWLPEPEFPYRLLQLAEEMRISGSRIFDLQIGLIAFENGATEIWTHDRQFVPLPGLLVHDPI